MVHLKWKVGDTMEQRKQWKEKAADYKMYAGVLVALSIFFYIGILLPIAPEKKPYLIGFIMILLTGAFFFYQKAIKYIRLLREFEQ
jgi:hypothetical protein